MVEALAKARYEDGIQLAYGRNVAADYDVTREHLDRDTATLFEATLVVGRRQARVDILQKKGATVRLLEVKAKSLDVSAHLANRAEGGNGGFRQARKPGAISADWRAKLEDVTYQVLMLEKLLPGVTIQPFLVLIDKSKQATTDNVPRFFEVMRRAGSDGVMRLQTARYAGTRDEILVQPVIGFHVSFVHSIPVDIRRSAAPYGASESGDEADARNTAIESRSNGMSFATAFHTIPGSMSS